MLKIVRKMEAIIAIIHISPWRKMTCKAQSCMENLMEQSKRNIDLDQNLNTIVKNTKNLSKKSEKSMTQQKV